MASLRAAARLPRRQVRPTCVTSHIARLPDPSYAPPRLTSAPPQEAGSRRSCRPAEEFYFGTFEADSFGLDSSLTKSIDTGTPAGWMLMQLLGSFAKHARAMVGERTAAGLAVARAEGRVGGRQPKLTPAQRADIAENVLSGHRTDAQMARLYAVSQPTVSRTVATFRVSRPDDAARA